MSSRSYPIFNVINSCAYASQPYTKGNKSFGVRKHSEINVKVGSSATHSFDLCTIKETKRDFGVWSVFRVSIDDKTIKQAFFNNTTKVFTRRMPTELKELIN
tara:strand:+ start:89 stop:394 length:306 start_codon:yes stop_codon:yes gene_type:complete